MAVVAAAGCGQGAIDVSGAGPESGGEVPLSGSSECVGSSYNCKLPCAVKDRNRIFNYATNSYDWPLAAATDLLDGLGNRRGLVAEPAVRINCGLRKSIGGVDHVYAFASALDSGVHASGWIRERALVHGPIRRMPTVKLGSPGHGDYEAQWTVTGGDPGAFGELKVLPRYTGAGVKATDYLARPGGVFNLCYNLPGLGGVAIDTFPINVGFRRAHGVAQQDIKLYKPGGSTVQAVLPFVFGHVGGRYGWVARAALTLAAAPANSAPTVAAPPPASTGQCYVRCCDGSLQGPVATTDGAACHEASKGICEQRGHVKRSEFNGAEVYAREAECATTSAPAPSPAPPAPPPPPPAAPPSPATGNCYVRCCDGSLTGPLALASAQSCHESSQGVCAARGLVKHSEFNGQTVYQRPDFCYARCAIHQAYHKLDVTSGCTTAATKWCSQSGRGGLADAKWSPCP